MQQGLGKPKMNLRTKLSFLVAVGCACLSGFLGAPVARPAQGFDVERRVENFEIRADDFLQALAKAAAWFRTPLGVEMVRTERTARPIYVSLRDVTVREIFQSLVATQPDYAMKIGKGIIDVAPARAELDIHDFLNIRIQRFQMREEYLEVGGRRLWGQIHLIVSPPEVRPTAEAGSMVIGPGDQRVTLELADGTVRDALNLLATAAGRNVWIVTYPEHTSYTSAGYRRAASLFVDAVPDEFQPSWHLLNWGFDPVSKAPQDSWLSGLPPSGQP